MLENFKLEYEPIPVPRSPELIMRYYKAKKPQKGIIMFVHGVSHGAWCWGNFVAFFTEEGYDCFAVNLRGHGDNNKKCTFFTFQTLENYLEDVKLSFDCLKKYCEDEKNKIPYSKPFLLGHSMGGAIVEQYISDYSHEVRAAILLAPATVSGMGWKGIWDTTVCETGLNTVPTVFGLEKSKQLKNAKRLKRIKKLSKSNFFAAKTNNKDCQERIVHIEDLKDLKDLKDFEGLKELEYYEENLCSESIRAMFGLKKFDIKKTDIPVYVIGSEKDAYFPKDSLYKTADFYNTKAEIIEGSCHDIMLDPKWEDAAKFILEFLKKPDDPKYTGSKQ